MNQKELTIEYSCQKTVSNKISLKDSQSKEQREISITSRGTSSHKDFLSQLSSPTLLTIINYLDHREHFQLAQASKRHLFLWGAITRVPPAFTVNPPPSSQETIFRWNDEWPKQITSSIAIEVQHNLDTKELARLSSLWKLGPVTHLRFFSNETSFTLDIEDFFCSSEKKLPGDLISLTFEGVAPFHNSCCYHGSPAKLQKIILKGRIAEEARNNMCNFVRALGEFRESTQEISFENPALCPEEMREIFFGVQINSKESPGTFEIKGEEEEEYDYLLSFNDFRRKPLIVHDQGIRIAHKRKEYTFIVIPGPALLQNVVWQQDETQEVLPFHLLFSRLYEEGVSLRELFPVLKARTNQRRAEILTHILKRNANVTINGGMITIERLTNKLNSLENVDFVQSQDILLDAKIRVAAFRRSSEVMEVALKDLLELLKDWGQWNTRVQQLLRERQGICKSRAFLLRWIKDILRCCEKNHIEPEELPDFKMIGSSDNEIRGVVYRNSRREFWVEMKDLVKLIREKANYNTQVHRLLEELPRSQDGHYRLLGWFQQMFELLKNEEQKQRESNNAEILLGSSLMDRVRHALTRKKE